MAALIFHCRSEKIWQEKEKKNTCKNKRNQMRLTERWQKRWHVRCFSHFTLSVSNTCRNLDDQLLPRTLNQFLFDDFFFMLVSKGQQFPNTCCCLGGWDDFAGTFWCENLCVSNPTTAVSEDEVSPLCDAWWMQALNYRKSLIMRHLWITQGVTLGESVCLQKRRRRRNNETKRRCAPPPHASPSSSIPLKWIILVILVTGRGLDFDLCSSKAKIKESISCYFMAVGMMNGPVSGPKQAAVSLPRILIAKVAGHCSRFNTQWEPEGPARSPLVTSAAACFSNVTAVSAARPPRNS